METRNSARITLTLFSYTLVILVFKAFKNLRFSLNFFTVKIEINSLKQRKKS